MLSCAPIRRDSAHTPCAARRVGRCPSRRALPIISGAAHHIGRCTHVVRCMSRHALYVRSCAVRQALRAGHEMRQQYVMVSTLRYPVSPVVVLRRLQHRGRALLPAVPIEPFRRPALAAVAPHRVRILSERMSRDSPWEIGRSRLAKDSHGYNVDAFQNLCSLEFDDW